MWGRGWGGVRGSVRTGLIVLAAAGLAASGAVTAEAGGAGQPAGTIYVQRTSVPVDTLAMAADGSALRSTGSRGTVRLPLRRDACSGSSRPARPSRPTVRA